MHNLEYSILEDFFFFELFLVFSIVIATYIIRLNYFLQDANKHSLMSQIEEYLSKLIATHEPFLQSTFLPPWRKIDILVLVICKMDTTHQEPEWQKIRMELITSIVLPLARRAALSRDWVLRFFAAQAFALSSDKNDEVLIEKLLEDRLPLVYLNALSAALMCRSERAINMVITRISKERRLPQTIYLKGFDHAPPETQIFIENRMKSETDPFTRATCYRILSKYPPKLTWDIVPDIRSNNIELKTAAIRYISYAAKDKAPPLLIESLKDKNWEAKTTALHCLGDLHEESALPSIAECLKDSEWWVRIVAAQTLKDFGEKGMSILKAQNVTENKDAYDAAKHVLDMLGG